MYPGNNGVPHTYVCIPVVCEKVEVLPYFYQKIISFNQNKVAAKENLLTHKEVTFLVGEL